MKRKHCVCNTQKLTDLLLLAPSCRALPILLDLLILNIVAIDITCNVKISVCMVFKRTDSLTGILFQLGLPSCNTTLCNGHDIFQRCNSSSKNDVVERLFSLEY